MLIKDELKIAFEWERYKGYTVRPLKSTIDYYENVILKYIGEGPGLMYGGTPEIRTLFQKYNLKLTMIDCSELMVRAMGWLTRSGIPIAKNENFVKSNWLKINPSMNKFPLLIGDNAINMINWDDFPIFIGNAHELLFKNGIFICHLLIKPADNLINENFFHLVNEFKCKNIKSHYDLASRLNFICYDEKNYGMGWQQTIKKIGKDRLEYLAHDFDFVGTFGFCNSKFYCPPKNKFEDLISNYFHVIETFYSSEHEYCMYEPAYILRKKNL